MATALDLHTAPDLPGPTSGASRFGDQPWIAEARCRQHPEVDFLDDTARHGSHRALAICAECPVVGACLDYARSLGASTSGVWGGTTEEQRTIARRQPTSVTGAP
ncbi:MAG: WhiB family transcriptional regulator [Acidimicrobiia bacterium]